MSEVVAAARARGRLRPGLALGADRVGARLRGASRSTSRERMVELTRARGVDARVGDVQSLEFADASFDAAAAAWMLYHVADVDRALSELARVLRPAGCLVTVTNSWEHLRELYELTGVERVPYTFSAENGEAQLGKHFASIERRDASGWNVFPGRAEAQEYPGPLDDVQGSAAAAVRRPAARAPQPRRPRRDEGLRCPRCGSTTCGSPWRASRAARSAASRSATTSSSPSRAASASRPASTSACTRSRRCCRSSRRSSGGCPTRTGSSRTRSCAAPIRRSGVVMRIERIDERALRTRGPHVTAPDAVVEVGLGLQSDKRPDEYVALARLARTAASTSSRSTTTCSSSRRSSRCCSWRGATERVRLGPAALNPFTLHPVEIAGQVAALDLVSRRPRLSRARRGRVARPDRHRASERAADAACARRSRSCGGCSPATAAGFAGARFELAPGAGPRTTSRSGRECR